LLLSHLPLGYSASNSRNGTDELKKALETVSIFLYIYSTQFWILRSLDGETTGQQDVDME